MTTRLAAAFLGCLVMAGCAGLRPAAPDPKPAATVADRWQAPLPHGGTVAELARWWAQFDDPLLDRLVGAAQSASPTLASAASRIEQARAARTAAGAALLPALDANAAAARGVQDVTLPHGTSASVGLQASWELDLFGRRGAALDGTTWSIGPVSVSLPIFDGGTRRADVAVVTYAGALRAAVRDVESALIALQASTERRADAQRAADNFDAYTRAVEAKYKSGLGSLFELEDARRSAFAAQNALIDLRREQVAAWIALYRALGGGWTPAADAALATAAPTGPSK
jgi:outer membrane protein, multidrug efflux system